jgi:hypothetical protein
MNAPRLALSEGSSNAAGACQPDRVQGQGDPLQLLEVGAGRGRARGGRQARDLVAAVQQLFGLVGDLVAGVENVVHFSP